MINSKHRSRILTSDFDALASEVAAAIWNRIIENPAFHALKVCDYPGLFEAVSHSLASYHVSPSANQDESRSTDVSREKL